MAAFEVTTEGQSGAPKIAISNTLLPHYQSLYPHSGQPSQLPFDLNNRNAEFLSKGLIQLSPQWTLFATCFDANDGNCKLGDTARDKSGHSYFYFLFPP
jgi:hypothetical protein